MMRVLLALAVGCLTAAAALGNAAAPPPPGKKFVRVDHLITTDKAYPDLEFYLATAYTAQKVAFDPNTPAKIKGNPGGPAFQIQLVAVPKGAAAKYAKHTAFAEALGTGQVPGQLTTERLFAVRVALDEKDKRKVVVEEHAVEKIDAKVGIVLRAAKAPTPKEKQLDEPPPPRAAGGTVVAGLAAALALAFAGLRIARPSLHRSRP
jgi:hypothetical protein